jgi:hypothetical protein
LRFGDLRPNGRDELGVRVRVKSGQEYVTPMLYLMHDADANVIYAFATRGGTPVNPDCTRT